MYNRSADGLNENDILGTPTQHCRSGCGSEENAILGTPTQNYRTTHLSNEEDVVGTPMHVDESNQNDVFDVSSQKYETRKYVFHVF